MRTTRIAATALLLFVACSKKDHPPPAVQSLALQPATAVGGAAAQATVTLDKAAGAAGVVVALASSDSAVAAVPASVTVASGETSATFDVATSPVSAAATVTLSATGGGQTGTAELTLSPPAIATVLEGAQGQTAFLQCIPMTEPRTDHDYEVGPGCANVWDLFGVDEEGEDVFGLADGGNDQWDGALLLHVGALTTQPPTYVSVDDESWHLELFGAASYAELSWTTPLLGADLPAVVVSDGATLANGSGAIDGQSAYLAPGSGTKLQQTIDLSAAAAPVTLTVSHGEQLIDWDRFDDQPPASFAIRLLDASGAELDAVFEANDSDMAIDATFDLSAAAGSVVTLSFEYKGSAGSDDGGINAGAMVDNVSVTDAGSAEHVTNGGFEEGLTGWTVARADEPLGVVTSPQTLAGLEVTRSFYAAPGSLWARFADELVNPGATEITTQVVYYTNLGSDSSGIIYDTPGVTGALTSWDGSGWGRDVAVVYGEGSAFYMSATALATDDGDDDFYVVHDLTVPPGGRVTLVHFVVQGGGNTGLTATDTTALATEVDAAAADIVTNFNHDVRYRDYMTVAQLDSIANF